MSDMEFYLFNCRFSINISFAAFLCLILLIDTTGIMLLGLLSALIHEIGHLIFMIIYKKMPCSVSFRLGGIIIDGRGHSGYKADFFIAIGGCLFNLFAFTGSYLIHCFTEDEILLLFSAANFGLFLFNALPISGLDGFDIIKNLSVRFFSEQKSEMICKTISNCVLILLAMTIIWLICRFGFNYTVTVCICYLIILTLINIKH